jgi:hypothetical protein
MPGSESIAGGKVRAGAMKERAVVEWCCAAHRAILPPAPEAFFMNRNCTGGTLGEHRPVGNPSQGEVIAR